MALTSLLLLPIVYRENLLSAHPEKKRAMLMTLVPGILVGIGLIFLIATNLYEPNLYVKGGKAYFPIDFEGSLNVAPVVLSLFPLIGFLAILVPNIRSSSKKEGEDEKE